MINGHTVNGAQVNGSGVLPLQVYGVMPSLLDSAQGVAFTDFSAAVASKVSIFVMDLTLPDDVVRVPISSWQATLQSGRSNFVQCVVPACTPWVDDINAATAFTVRRVAEVDGLPIEYEMATSPLENATFSQGTINHTCTLSGYTDGFTPDEDPPAVYDRDLTGVRSITTGNGTRVRCNIDWLLRPGHRAIVGATSFVVDYINYYALLDSRQLYMDVGSRG